MRGMLLQQSFYCMDQPLYTTTYPLLTQPIVLSSQQPSLVGGDRVGWRSGAPASSSWWGLFRGCGALFKLQSGFAPARDTSLIGEVVHDESAYRESSREVMEDRQVSVSSLPAYRARLATEVA
jgi:hypothetical protein